MQQHNASDGTPLENHYQVLMAKQMFKIEDAFVSKNQECLDEINQVIEKATELNFPDKNKLNQNLYPLQQDLLTLAKMFFNIGVILHDDYYEKYMQ